MPGGPVNDIEAAHQARARLFLRMRGGHPDGPKPKSGVADRRRLQANGENPGPLRRDLAGTMIDACSWSEGPRRSRDLPGGVDHMQTWTSQFAKPRFLPLFGLLSCLVLVSPWPVRSAGLDGEDAPVRWRLACRLASYGKFQDAAWSHLPSIGVHHVFLSVPEAGEVVNVQQRLEAHHLKPLVMRGHADLGDPKSVDELARQLAVCERMGVRYMFLSPRHDGRGQGGRLRAAATRRGDRQAARRGHRAGDPSRPGHQRRRASADDGANPPSRTSASTSIRETSPITTGVPTWSPN